MVKESALKALSGWQSKIIAVCCILPEPYLTKLRKHNHLPTDCLSHSTLTV